MDTQYVQPPDGGAVMLDEQKDSYTLRVRDLPKEAKPREKLQKYGPRILSSQELLAVVLGVGTRKEEVLSMARRIIKEYGEKGFVYQQDPVILAEHIGIPLTKACQIIACAELGRRFFQETDAGRPVLRRKDDVFAYVREMGSLRKEQLRGLYLDRHYRIIHDEVISIGTAHESVSHPREVFRPGLVSGAAALILVHNHPSGSLVPSDADLVVTRQLIEAGRVLGIELLDHVIVTKKGSVSIFSRL